MEFLGDAVLELAVSAYLYKNMLSAKEGRLTAIRAGLVNERALYKVAKSIDLGRFILLGRGEIKSGGFDKTSILSDVMEAVLGAVFLDAGFRAVVEVVNKLWVKMFKLAFKGHIIKDPKTRLQELIQEQYKVTPTYRTVKTEGPDHQRTFYVEVLCKKDILCSGAGSSKKEAEQNAAEKALEKMGYENDND
jgi:ribonuclease-3